MPYALQLVAYTPFGDMLGVLPNPLAFTWTRARYRWPTLDLTYSPVGPASDRFDWLTQPVEVALTWLDDDTGETEPDYGRLLLTKHSWDDSDPKAPHKFRFHGLGWVWDRIDIFDETTQDPAKGTFLPERWWTDKDAGNIMVPLVNASITRVFESFVPDPPTKEFALGQDFNNVAWAEILPGKQRFRITQKVGEVESLLIEAGVAEPAWHGREYRLYNFGTYGTDRSEGGDALVIRGAHGVTSSPCSDSYEDLAKTIQVVGRSGQRLILDNEEMTETPYGALESSVEAASTDDLAAMELIARGEKRRTARPAAQLSKEWEGSGSSTTPRPFRDYVVGDRVQDEAGERPWVTEMSITHTKGQKLKGHVKLGDRHEDRQARLLMRLRRLTLGTGGGISGPAGQRDDHRLPMAPSGVTVVNTDRFEDSPRADQLISWTPLPFALDEDGNPTLDEIELSGFQIAEAVFGNVEAVFATITDPTVTSWTRPGAQVSNHKIKVRQISHEGFAGPYSSEVDGDYARPADPGKGPNRVLDPGWQQPAINAARVADTIGLAFTDTGGRKRAVLTTSSAVLRTRRGGHANQGWYAVTPTDKWLVGGTDRRVGIPAVSARYGMQWRNAAGTVTDVTNVGTHVSTASDVRSVYEWTVPSGAVEAAWRATTDGWTTGGRLEIVDPVFERRASTERIEDLAVVEGKIGNNAVIERIMADLSVATRAYIDRSMTGIKIAVRTILAENIVANTITAGEIAAGTITAGEIAAGAITTDKLAANAVTAAKIAAGTITANEIDSGMSLTVVFLGAASGTFGTLRASTNFGLGASTRGPYELAANPTTQEIAALLSDFGLATLV